MNKKGFISDVLTDGWALITYILIIIVFFIIFSFGKGEIKVEIKADAENNDCSIILRDYLRTPYQDGTVADLIARTDIVGTREFLSEPDREKKAADYAKLAAATTAFFNSQFRLITAESPPVFNGRWGIKIYDLSKNAVAVISNTGIVPDDEVYMKYLLASQIIPGVSSNYKVELWSEFQIE